MRSSFYERDPVTRHAAPALHAVHPLGKSPVLIDGDVTVAETSGRTKARRTSSNSSRLSRSISTRIGTSSTARSSPLSGIRICCRSQACRRPSRRRIFGVPLAQKPFRRLDRGRRPDRLAPDGDQPDRRLQRLGPGSDRGCCPYKRAYCCGPTGQPGLVARRRRLRSGGKRYATFLVEPFINYNFGHGWFVSSAPIITDDETHAGRKWTVRLRAGSSSSGASCQSNCHSAATTPRAGCIRQRTLWASLRIARKPAHSGVYSCLTCAPASIATNSACASAISGISGVGENPRGRARERRAPRPGGWSIGRASSVMLRY